MEYCDPADRGFKTSVTEKSNELQESSERQFNKLRNKIKGQMEYCTKEIETLKKNKNYGAEESNKQDRKCKWKALEIEETTGERENEWAWRRKSRNDSDPLEEERKWKEVKVAQSCPTLCDPMDYTDWNSWEAIPFPRGSSQPRDQTQVSCIADGFFTSWATREAQRRRENISKNEEILKEHY